METQFTKSQIASLEALGFEHVTDYNYVAPVTDKYVYRYEEDIPDMCECSLWVIIKTIPDFKEYKVRFELQYKADESCARWNYIEYTSYPVETLDEAFKLTTNFIAGNIDKNRWWSIKY